MAEINIGGRMPDGVKVHEFWVKKKRFVCAAGTAMEVEGVSKKLKGKLCLLTNALVMLPYEGTWLKVGQFIIGQMQGWILGEYADMADLMERLKLIDRKANYENLDKILIWPLTLIEGDCWVEKHSILGMGGGASLHISMDNRDHAFSMLSRGHEVGDFASAEDFCEAIQELI